MGIRAEHGGLGTPFSPPLRVLYSIFYLLSIEICEGMGFSNNRKPKAHPCNPRMEHPLAPPATASIPEAVALALKGGNLDSEKKVGHLPGIFASRMFGSDLQAESTVF